MNSQAPNDVQSEFRLIELCQKQNPEAFGKFVDLYQARVFGFVRRMVTDAEDAADITQEVFIRAFQSFSRFDGRSQVKTWLFKIAHNLCIDRSRKVNRTLGTSSLESSGEDLEVRELADESAIPEQLVLNDELKGVVEAAILEMSDKLRAVLLLHDQQDVGYDEIADLLSIPVGTVKSRLFLARNFVQSRLSAYMNPSVK